MGSRHKRHKRHNVPSVPHYFTAQRHTHLYGVCRLCANAVCLCRDNFADNGREHKKWQTGLSAVKRRAQGVHGFTAQTHKPHNVPSARITSRHKRHTHLYGVCGCAANAICVCRALGREFWSCPAQKDFCAQVLVWRRDLRLIHARAITGIFAIEAIKYFETEVGMHGLK